MLRRVISLSVSVALLAAGLPVVPAAQATSLVHFWSKRFGNSSVDGGASVAVDGFGNVHTTGHVTFTFDFGGGNLAGAGAQDVYLVKYAPDGAHLWSKRFGGTGSDYGISVALDGSGNVFVTGQFANTVDFGGGGLLSAGSADIFLAKYDANGVHQWSKRFGSTGFDVGQSVAADAAGSVLVTGNFSDTVDFGGGNLLSAGGSDMFLAKYDAGGVHQWSKRFGSTGGDVGQSVAADAAGNVVATGSFFGTVDFGGGNLVSAGTIDVVLAKYDGGGAHLWSKRFGSTGGDHGYAVALDAAGSIVVTGDFLGTVDFGGGALVSAGSSDIFVAGYDAGGVHRWSRRSGGTLFDVGHSVAVDGAGDALVTGSFQNTADFGGGNLTSAGGSDLFIAKYDDAGAHRWSVRLGSTLTDEGRSAAVDPFGHFVTTGTFQATVNFGGGDFVGAGSTDAYLAKYSRDAAEPVITSIADLGNDQGGQVLIEFARSGHDDPLAPAAVAQYEAYRRIDAPPATAPVGVTGRELYAEGWTEVGTVAAHGESGYSMVVPTIGDSTEALGQYQSVFFVRAATATPTTYFDSPIDSGYSVDNLAPGIPGSLSYNAGVLSWNESPAGDFDYFTVYGANLDDFGVATVVNYTVTPTLNVNTSPYTFYYVTATDFSGNEGNPAKVNTLTGAGGTPGSYVLSVSNFPNPFNPRTTVSYTVPSRGAVTVAIYDVHGARVATLVNNQIREEGAYRLEWDGRAGGGASVSSGIYFARIEHAGATRTKKLVLLK